MGVLVAGVLASGIVAGTALGPRPASSPADSSTLALRAIVALATRASNVSVLSTPASIPLAPAPESKATTTRNPKPTAKAAPAAPSYRRTTSTSSERSVEHSAGAPSSQGASGERSASAPSSADSPSKGSSDGERNTRDKPIKLPEIKHVWLIALSGESFTNAITRTSSYLVGHLIPKGALLSGYTPSANSALANGIALLSGQGVNLDTEQNCPTYVDLQPASVSAGGLTEGVGCVYPKAVQTLPDELTAAGLTWKAYVQGMETAQPSVGASAPSCRHPELGAADPNHVLSAGDPYLTFNNPFVYFHSLLDGGACASDDVELTRLTSDLATTASTPNLSWIAPSACGDGTNAPRAPGTTSAPGASAESGSADRFLAEVVPQILATAAFRKEGLLAIVPDSEPAASIAKPVGALLISPFVRSGVRVDQSLNDYSLLKSLTRLFGVLPLGHANDPSAVSFGAPIYRTTK
jgi:hypothetical protein